MIFITKQLDDISKHIEILKEEQAQISAIESIASSLLSDGSKVSESLRKAGIGVSPQQVLDGVRLHKKQDGNFSKNIYISLRGDFIGKNKPMKHDPYYSTTHTKKRFEKARKLEQNTKTCLDFECKVTINEFSLEMGRNDNKIMLEIII